MDLVARHEADAVAGDVVPQPQAAIARSGRQVIGVGMKLDHLPTFWKKTIDKQVDHSQLALGLIGNGPGKKKYLKKQQNIRKSWRKANSEECEEIFRKNKNKSQNRNMKNIKIRKCGAKKRFKAKKMKEMEENTGERELTSTSE